MQCIRWKIGQLLVQTIFSFYTPIKAIIIFDL